MLIKGLIALAFGTLGLGITEFVAMGLLPYWAEYFSVSVAEAGYGVSAYALGVSFGAFSIIVMRTMKLKTILLLLIVVHIIGNLLTVIAPDFNTLIAARFIAGLPHGSFFGVGSIIAQRLAAKGKGTSAVAIMIAGMTVANIFGVPLGTALAGLLSWHAIFFIVVFWGLLVFVSALLWIKDTGRIKDNGFKSQFLFLKDPAPWLVLGATMFGNAGIFCMLSYVSPLLTDLSGISLNAVAAVMVCIGITMVAGNLVAGRLSDRYTPGIIAFVFQILACFCLLGIGLLGDMTFVGIVLICICAGCMFAISAPEQVSILRVAPGGLLLGASMIQAAFNLGNALGATVGGIPFIFDMSVRYVPLIGIIPAVLGVICLYFYMRKHENRFPDPAEGEVSEEEQDAIAQAPAGSMDHHEFGLSAEAQAAHDLRKAASEAARAAAREVFVKAEEERLRKEQEQSQSSDSAEGAEAQKPDPVAAEDQKTEPAAAEAEAEEQKADPVAADGGSVKTAEPVAESSVAERPAVSSDSADKI